jgi:hypothetical protein
MEKRIETDRMTLVSERLKDKEGLDLRAFIERERTAGGDGATWDDIAFNIRTITGMRITRESARGWGTRYGIPEPEHDYGVRAEDMPDPVE